jgi:diadenosine tetraphosphate (Ap4A) HIT family hydrolase
MPNSSQNACANAGHESYENCRFCRGNDLLSDKPLGLNRSFYLLAGNDPALPKAVMVVSDRHIITPFELRAEEWSDMEDALQMAKTHLSKWSPDGYTIGWNVGIAGGQSVFHAHLHVFARFNHGRTKNQGIRGMLKQQADLALQVKSGSV